MARTWLRLHHDMLGDRKLAHAAADTGQPLAVVMAAWVAVLIRASKARPRGSIAGLTAERIARDIAAEPAVAQLILAAFASLGMLKNGSVARWHRRQIETDNTAAERMRRLRRRRAQVIDSIEHVTPVTSDETPVTGVTCYGRNDSESVGDSTPCAIFSDVNGASIGADSISTVTGVTPDAPLKELSSLERNASLRSNSLSLSLGDVEESGRPRAIARGGREGAGPASEEQGRGIVGWLRRLAHG